MSHPFALSHSSLSTPTHLSPTHSTAKTSELASDLPLDVPIPLPPPTPLPKNSHPEALNSDMPHQPTWVPAHVVAFVGVSSPYDIPSLVDHFDARGLYRRLYVNIMCKKATCAGDSPRGDSPDISGPTLAWEASRKAENTSGSNGWRSFVQGVQSGIVQRVQGVQNRTFGGVVEWADVSKHAGETSAADERDTLDPN